MTAIHNTFASLSETSSTLIYFFIEVISYDGESHFVDVEARTPDEAMDLAVARVPEADYAMIQSWIPL